jgi:hypothetical protein
MTTKKTTKNAKQEKPAAARSTKKQQKELGEEELEAVAGGTGPSTRIKFFAAPKRAPA